jgi:hypothetical protein
LVKKIPQSEKYVGAACSHDMKTRYHITKGGIMKRILLLLSVFVFILSFDNVNAEKKWWQEWPRFPKGNRITAKQVKQLQQAGSKMVFVYSGYEVNEVVCGSLIIPYNKVPPEADGSRIRVRIPKDWWVMCY